jgi:YggT family protein
MAQVIRETRIDDNVDRNEVATSPTGMVARIVYLISGIITTLLAIRFILVLLGANPANAFANLIYSVTRPLVAPFFGLFNYDATLGIARFEFETLVAMVVYMFVAWVIVRLVTLNRGPVE